MSSSRQLISVNFDQSTSKRVVIVGSVLADPDASQQMYLFYGTQALFWGDIFSAVPSVNYNPDAGATWLFGIDDTPFSTTPDYVLSQNDKFNISGDRPGQVVESGKICWRADFTTAELLAALKLPKYSGYPVWVPMYACLWMQTVDGNVMIAQWPVYIGKPYVDPTTAIPVEGITYLTTAAASAYFVPMWGDQEKWRYVLGTGWQYLFSDLKWRTFAPTLVDGNPVITWGNAEDV